MLHLDARVHLDEVQLARLVHQELDGAGVGVADCAHRLAQLRLSSARAAPSSRPATAIPPSASDAAAGCEHSRSPRTSHIAVLVRQHLKFDMPRRVDEFLEVDVGDSERRPGFLLRLREQRPELVRCTSTTRMPRPPPPADAFRSPDSRSASASSSASSGARSTPSEPGRIGTPSVLHAAARALLHAHQARSRPAVGPMNLMPEPSHTSAKLGVLAQESVAGMDRVDVGDFRRADDATEYRDKLRALLAGPMQIASSAKRTCSCRGRLPSRRRRSGCPDPCTRR